MQKYFLFKYWKDRYPTQTEAAYQGYMNVVKAVDNQFYSAFGKGHQTDRGYIFLKYGKPNKVMSVDDEANTPPYEIWYYDVMPKTNQTNVRFIFTALCWPMNTSCYTPHAEANAAINNGKSSFTKIQK